MSIFEDGIYHENIAPKVADLGNSWELIGEMVRFVTADVYSPVSNKENLAQIGDNNPSILLKDRMLAIEPAGESDLFLQKHCLKVSRAMLAISETDMFGKEFGNVDPRLIAIIGVLHDIGEACYPATRGQYCDLISGQKSNEDTNLESDWTKSVINSLPFHLPLINEILVEAGAAAVDKLWIFDNIPRIKEALIDETGQLYNLLKITDKWIASDAVNSLPKRIRQQSGYGGLQRTLAQKL